MKTAMHIIAALIVSIAAACICDASCPTPSGGTGLRAPAASFVYVIIRVTHVNTGEPLPDMYVEILDLGWLEPVPSGYTDRNGEVHFNLWESEFLATVYHNGFAWPCEFKVVSDTSDIDPLTIEIPINPDIG